MENGRRALGEDYFAKLAYVGHVNGLKDDLSATENIRIWAGVSGTPVAPEEARDALRRLGLEGREDLPVRWLSQGQKRRAALARVLVAKRPLWVLDEPFTALDRAVHRYRRSASSRAPGRRRHGAALDPSGH